MDAPPIDRHPQLTNLRKPIWLRYRRKKPRGAARAPLLVRMPPKISQNLRRFALDLRRGVRRRWRTNRIPLALASRHRIGGEFFVACRLVAATLPARDPAAVVPFNRRCLHVAALSWADGDTTWADANCGVGVVPPATVPIVAVVAVPPDLNIDALGHLEALGLGRSGERGSCQHNCRCRHGKSDLHHVRVLLALDFEV